MILILITIAAAVVAWLVIPTTRKPNGPPNPPEALSPVFNWPTPGPTPGPFQASVEEKMSVIESELRSRQADKYRKQVIDEVAELVGSTSSKAK